MTQMDIGSWIALIGQWVCALGTVVVLGIMLRLRAKERREKGQQ
jgi:hypothetical protein